jgi:DNA helicase-2/ATP-dependent DNA helicase PcrA
VNALLAELNPEQRQVALHPGHTLAIACPGAGKTKTMATKAALLLDQGDKVCAVTFTRDAALELRERIMKLADPRGKSRLLVGTFHSVCLLMATPHKHKGEFGRDILAGMRSPFASPPILVKEGVRVSYVMRAIRESGLKMPVRDATPIIETVKEAGGKLTTIEPEVQQMVDLYVQLMNDAGVIDFQDIILRTNSAMRDGSMSPMPVDHLLIDEYQDTDKAQYEWAAHHGKAGVALTVVGDDDQSIYAFRRALGFAGMEQFAKQFGALQVLLGTNYRCRAEILAAAEQLVSRNKQRIEKRLFAAKGAGGTIIWESFKDNTTEYAAAAEEAMIARDEGAGFAVIARTNDELTLLQAAMTTRGVAYRKTDGRSIFDCPEVQACAALLRLLVKPASNDLDVVLAWAGMDVEDTRKIRKLFGVNIMIGSRDDFLNAGISSKGIDIWRTFAKRHAGWATAKEQGFHATLSFGVHEWLSETLQKPSSQAILDAAREIYKPNDCTLEEQLATVREREEKQKAADKKDERPEGEGPVALLTTAHGSKGLEFDRVWIVGLDTGAFPSEKSSLEEERRLMFVAMTRAREILYVSGTKVKKPSVFVTEAGLIQ